MDRGVPPNVEVCLEHETPLRLIWLWLKITQEGQTAVLIHVSTYQGSILVPVFGATAIWGLNRLARSRAQVDFLQPVSTGAPVSQVTSLPPVVKMFQDGVYVARLTSYPETNTYWVSQGLTPNGNLCFASQRRRFGRKPAHVPTPARNTVLV